MFTFGGWVGNLHQLLADCQIDLLESGLQARVRWAMCLQSRDKFPSLEGMPADLTANLPPSGDLGTEFGCCDSPGVQLQALPRFWAALPVEDFRFQSALGAEGFHLANGSKEHELTETYYRLGGPQASMASGWTA